MSSNEKIICCLCEATVIKKNLKTHYTRRHPNKDLKWKSATSNEVRNFFSGNQQQEKRKDSEKDEIESILQITNAGNKRSRLEGTPKKSDVDCSKGDEGPSTSLQALLHAVKGKKKNLFLF